MINEGLEPQIYWDDWIDIRDGLRYNPDVTHLRNVRNGYTKSYYNEEIIEANKKIKKLILRRRLKRKNV